MAHIWAIEAEKIVEVKMAPEKILESPQLLFSTKGSTKYTTCTYDTVIMYTGISNTSTSTVLANNDIYIYEWWKAVGGCYESVALTQ